MLLRWGTVLVFGLIASPSLGLLSSQTPPADSVGPVELIAKLIGADSIIDTLVRYGVAGADLGPTFAVGDVITWSSATRSARPRAIGGALPLRSSAMTTRTTV